MWCAKEEDTNCMIQDDIELGIFFSHDQRLFTNDTAEAMGDEYDMPSFFTFPPTALDRVKQLLGKVLYCRLGLAKGNLGRIAIGESTRSRDVIGQKVLESKLTGFRVCSAICCFVCPNSKGCPVKAVNCDNVGLLGF